MASLWDMLSLPSWSQNAQRNYGPLPTPPIPPDVIPPEPLRNPAIDTGFWQNYDKTDVPRQQNWQSNINPIQGTYGNVSGGLLPPAADVGVPILQSGLSSENGPAGPQPTAAPATEDKMGGLLKMLSSIGGGGGGGGGSSGGLASILGSMPSSKDLYNPDYSKQDQFAEASKPDITKGHMTPENMKLLSILAGVGGMNIHPGERMGLGMLRGLGAGTQAYMGMNEKELERAQRDQEIMSRWNMARAGMEGNKEESKSRRSFQGAQLDMHRPEMMFQDLQTNKQIAASDRHAGASNALAKASLMAQLQQHADQLQLQRDTLGETTRYHQDSVSARLAAIQARAAAGSGAGIPIEAGMPKLLQLAANGQLAHLGINAPGAYGNTFTQMSDPKATGTRAMLGATSAGQAIDRATQATVMQQMAPQILEAYKDPVKRPQIDAILRSITENKGKAGSGYSLEDLLMGGGE